MPTGPCYRMSCWRTNTSRRRTAARSTAAFTGSLDTCEPTPSVFNLLFADASELATKAPDLDHDGCSQTEVRCWYHCGRLAGAFTLADLGVHVPISVFTRRSRRSRSDLGVHDGDLAVHDAALSAFAMMRVNSSSGGRGILCAAQRSANALHCWTNPVNPLLESSQPSNWEDPMQVSVGLDHICILLADSRVFCWGRTSMEIWATEP